MRRVDRLRMPITYEGVDYPSRKHLARHFAATRGGPVGSWEARLSSTNGDVERALAMVRPPPTMRDYDGKSFPSRRALSLYLAAKFGGKWPTWNKRLQLTKDDVTAAVRQTLRGSGKGPRISSSARHEGA